MVQAHKATWGSPKIVVWTKSQGIWLRLNFNTLKNSGFYQFLGSVIGQDVGQLLSSKSQVPKKIKSFSKDQQDSSSQFVCLCTVWCLHGAKGMVGGMADSPSINIFSALMVLNHSLFLVCIYCYLFVLSYCHHGDSHANSNTEQKFILANFKRKENGERKIDGMTWYLSIED